MVAKALQTGSSLSTAQRLGPLPWAAGAAFASFYCFYSAAPRVLSETSLPAGVWVAGLMVIVVLIQPVMLVLGRYLSARAMWLSSSLLLMGLGLLALLFGPNWWGFAALGIGFGVFVVLSAAWVKELADPGEIGRALGLYGLGSAIGGAVGSPLGLGLAGLLPDYGPIVGAAGLALAGVVILLPKALRPWRDADGPGTAALQVSSGGPMAQEPRWHSGDMAIIGANVLGHFIAVTLYAAVLTSVATLGGSAAVAMGLVAAFVTQVAVAAGRLVGGHLSDRWGARWVFGSSALILTAGFTMGLALETPVLVACASGLVGLAAGAIQTTALTVMMRRATTRKQTEAISVTWNMAFDLALGLGALLATTLLIS